MGNYLRSSRCLAAASLILALLPVANLLAQKNKPEKARPAWKDKVLQYDNYIYESNIRTMQFYRDGNELSYPYLMINDGGFLTLEFDELNASPQEYYVAIEHCDADWQRSMLVSTEYYSNIANFRILNYRSSQNTRRGYMHYSARIPEEGARFKHSGNYLLKVYRDNNPRDLILTRRFVVAEEAIRIVPDLTTLPQQGGRLRMQSVNFKLYPTAVPIRDPYTELNVQLLQNFRWDNRKTQVRPTYMFPDYWEYRFDAANDFAGGNEFRWFDLRDLSRKLNRIAQITYTDSCDRVTLQPDKPRTSNTYFTEPDFNGAYFIGIRNYPMGHIEADYVCTDFILQSQDLRSEGEVYLFGQMTDWRLDPRYRLEWDGELYYADVLLKQGIYNYQFVLKPNNPDATPDEVRLEGSHSETENAYTILIYYRLPADRTDRLIGIRHLNSWN
ncbi:MAG: DUF5103 domain-containing protein [Bacteroidetes bacterium]|nr:DUF5103 domain-containing protein [Bacteroidota bacterium]